jgi:hypothetical protein
MREKIAALIRGYYFITPVFLLVDLTAGMNVRAAGLEHHPVYKILYYLFCGGCYFGMRARPDWTGLIARYESAINLGVLVIAFMIPYYDFIGSLGEQVGPPPVTPERVINFVIAAAVGCLAHYGTPRTSGKV